MKFDKKLSSWTNLLDNIFASLSIGDFTNNNLFYFDDMTCESYAKIISKNSIKNSICIAFTLSPEGIEVDIEDLSIVAEWNLKQLSTDKENIHNLIVSILTSFVFYESNGRGKTVLSFFSSEDGMFEFTLVSRELFSPKSKKLNKMFFPLVT